ncbi:MAG TPA: ATPase domain-containing protein, partial [Gammaproteobacteria bacterium]
MDLKRIASGIQGLDDILLGGLLAGRVYLIEGMSGTGKTILANQVCFHHVQSGNRAVFMTLLAEGHGHMLENLSTLDFYDEAKVADTLHYISAYQVLEQNGLEALIQFIAGAKKKFDATLLVIDGFSICREFAKSDIEYIRFVHKLCTL